MADCKVPAHGILKRKPDEKPITEKSENPLGKYKHLPLMETLTEMKSEEKDLEEAKFRRCTSS